MTMRGFLVFLLLFVPNVKEVSSKVSSIKAGSNQSLNKRYAQGSAQRAVDSEDDMPESTFSVQTTTSEKASELATGKNSPESTEKPMSTSTEPDNAELPIIHIVDCKDIDMVGFDKCLSVKFSYLEEYAGLDQDGSPDVLVGKLYDVNGTENMDSRVSASFESDSDFFVVIHDPSDEELYKLKVDLQTGETEGWNLPYDGTEIYDALTPPTENTTLTDVPSDRQVPMPSQGFRLTVQPFVDQAFRNKFGGSVQTRVNAVFAHAKTYFAHGSLQTKFELDVKPLQHYAGTLRATDPEIRTFSTWISSGGGTVFPLVNTYVLLSFENYARGMVGIAFKRSVCHDRKYRTNINEYTGDVLTAETVVHEIGHNLGMTHDFLNNKPSDKSTLRVKRYSSTGEACTDVGGYMDYAYTRKRWSACSVEDMTSYYNAVGPTRYGTICMGTLNCEARTKEGDCRYMDKNTCLTSVEIRDSYKGQPCVWCPNKCQTPWGKGWHCEPKSVLSSSNYEDCLPESLITYEGIWGSWGQMQKCKNNGHAIDFKIRVEGPQGGDDTALNSICLKCSGGDEICSRTGWWGDWYEPSTACNEGYSGFKIKFEWKQGGDDTAVNDLELRCGESSVNTNSPNLWGDWTTYWTKCKVGQVICGLKTRVESDQGGGDDTALNGVQFACCNKHADKCVTLKLTTKNKGKEISWRFGTCSSKQTYSNNAVEYVQCCQPPGNYNFECVSYGDGWHGGYMQIGSSSTKLCETFTSGHSKVIANVNH